jgi:hypothetical protein
MGNVDEIFLGLVDVRFENSLEMLYDQQSP